LGEVKPASNTLSKRDQISYSIDLPLSHILFPRRRKLPRLSLIPLFVGAFSP
jgi:hypothetical protein